MGTVSPTTKISAFSAQQVSLLHDPELVEDFSDILNRSDRLSSKSLKKLGQVDAHGRGIDEHGGGEEEEEEERDEEEKSNTGSVVITKGVSGSGQNKFSLQRASMFSSSSSRYSRSDTDTDAGVKDGEDNTEGREAEAGAGADADADGMVTADEGDVMDEDGDGSSSNWNDKVDTSVRSDATEDITVTQTDNKNLDDSRDTTERSSNQTNEKNKSDEADGLNETDEADEDDATLNLDYSDSEFEEGLGTRMQQLDSADYRRNSNVSNDSDETSSKLSQHSRGDTIEVDGDLSSIDQGIDVGSDEEFLDGDEEADLEAEFQPLPPPTELDPGKLYALYPFNGPDASHCQLEQDEPCILLNDQDVYWWLVKRCRDNKIGFAPAEILETFPERLARLNCWKNENMSSSSRDLTVINKVSDELVGEEEEEEKENGDHKEGIDKDGDNKITTSNEGKHTLKNYKKSGKSVSFSDIVSYADRYIEYSDVGDEDSVIEEEEEEEREKKNVDKENGNGVSTLHRNARHYDKFGEETLQFDDEDDNMSETLSETSFSTGFAQPLVLTKRRAAAHKANRDSFGSGHTRNGSNSSNGEASRPSSQESCYRASSEGEDSENEIGQSKKTNKGVGTANTALTDSDSDSEDIEETKDGHRPWDMMHSRRYRDVDETSPDKNDNSNDNSNSSNYEDNHDHNGEDEDEDDDNPQKIFEAPTAPFLSKTGSTDASNSRNSVSTLGEFSPSSLEYTAADFDSPKKTLSVAPDIIVTPRSPTSLPSSHAIQDIPMFLRAGRPDSNSNINEIEDQSQEQAPDQESLDLKVTNKEENGDTTQISSESNYKVDDTLTKVCTQTSVTTVEELSMDPIIVTTTTTGIVIPSNKLSTKARLPSPEVADQDRKRVEVSHIDRLPSNGSYHPVIDEIYAPFFRQIDELISKIDRLLQS